MIKKISSFFCTGFGVGNIPLMPGTFASLLTLPFIWLIKSHFSLEILISGIIIYYLISHLLLKVILNDKKNMDPSNIVCDEYIGQSIALLFCEQKVLDYFIAFIFFRILDIKKPYPISYFDKLKTVSGVLLDDVVAGVIVAFTFLIYYEVWNLKI